MLLANWPIYFHNSFLNSGAYSKKQQKNLRVHLSPVWVKPKVDILPMKGLYHYVSRLCFMNKDHLLLICIWPTYYFHNKKKYKMFWIVWGRVIYIYIYISSSSSYRAGSTDIPDPLSPLLPIVHRPRQVFRTTSCILTQLLNVRSCWSSCFCAAVCGDP